MPKILALVIPRRRVKTLIWLTGIIVLVQFFVFVAVQMRSDKGVYTEDCSTLENTAQSPPQGLYNEAFEASVLSLQAQTKDNSTHEREIQFDSTKAETVHKSRNNVVNVTRSSNETIRDFITRATSAKGKTVLIRDGLENTTAAFKKQDASNNESVPDIDCKQLKNRTSVNDVLSKFETNVTKRTFSGRRIFGYVHPTTTGDFVFAISSADGSELWLSTDDDPKHSRKIAFLGDPGNQYGATTKYAQFAARKDQISENIRLEAGKAYYIEVLQKQKYNQDHVEVAWKMPGKEKLEIIESQFLSQYIDYSADKEEINGRVLCIGKDHPTLQFAYDEFMTREKYDMRDDFHVRVETLPHSEVSDVLPSCPYHPSFLVSRKLIENEAFSGKFIHHPRVYPDDRTDVNMSHDIKNHISWGNKKLPKSEALKTVSLYMDSLAERKGDRFTLKEIVNVEAKDDPEKGTRFLLELELVDKQKGRSVRLSEYVYRTDENSSDLCYPEGFQWRRNVTVSMVITVKNYGPWIKFLISQLDQIYQQGEDRNFFLVIVDFNSSDIDLFKLREKSGIKDR